MELMAIDRRREVSGIIERADVFGDPDFTFEAIGEEE